MFKKQLKSYNKVPTIFPSIIFDVLIYEIIGLALFPILSILVGYMIHERGDFLGLVFQNIPPIDLVYVVVVWQFFWGYLGVYATFSRYNNFHNGVWMGESPSKSSIEGCERLESRPFVLKKQFSVWCKGKVPRPEIVIGGIGNKKNKLLTMPITHSLLIGGSGSGKSTTVLTPTQIALISAGCSAITTDPKGEEFALTGRFSMQQPNRKTICLDFSDPLRSDGWDPLKPAKDCAQGLNGRRAEEMSSELRILADTLIPRVNESSPVWSQSARILFCGLAAFVIESDAITKDCKNISTIASLASMPQIEMQGIIEKLPITSTARNKLEKVVFAAEETYTGFVSNFNSYLEIYSDPSISGMLNESSFEIEDFAKQPVQIYLRYSSSSEAFNALISAFLSQTIGGLRRLAETHCNGTLPIPLFLLLEEFPQLVKLPNLANDLGIIRGQGMHALVVTQGRKMIEARYGKDSGALFDAFDTTIYCSSNDSVTHTYYEQKLGNYTVETKTQTQSTNSFSGGKSESISYRSCPLFRREHLDHWNYNIGHLVMTKKGTYACSSIPTSKTFVGDMLNMNGSEPNENDIARLIPERPIKNPEPAKIWDWRNPQNKPALNNISGALESIEAQETDPRFM